MHCILYTETFHANHLTWYALFVYEKVRRCEYWMASNKIHIIPYVVVDLLRLAEADDWVLVVGADDWSLVAAVDDLVRLVEELAVEALDVYCA